MLSPSLSELPATLLAHKEIVYITLGTLLASLGLHYASKVNRVSEGEPPLLPGALPLFGHALSFIRNSNKVYEKARYANSSVFASSEGSPDLSAAGMYARV